MTRVLLDTNIVSSLSRHGARCPVRACIAALGEGAVCPSAIAAAEIRYGVARKGSVPLAAAAERVLGALDVLPLGPPASIAYGAIRADLERRGLVIGGNDLLIAAQCLSLDVILATNNTREFARVAGLRIEDWPA